MYTNADSQPFKKKLTPAQALSHIYKYCAYQERSHLEVKRKLYSYGLYASDVDELLTKLITDGYLNEERFAKAYAGGKFRIKKWGRNKITHQLESQGLTKRCIEAGLRELDKQDYEHTLRQLILKKMELLTEPNAFKKRNLVARFVLAKGYEADLVWHMVKEISASSS
jgi:regulatory protein